MSEFENESAADCKKLKRVSRYNDCFFEENGIMNVHEFSDFPPTWAINFSASTHCSDTESNGESDDDNDDSDQADEDQEGVEDADQIVETTETLFNIATYDEEDDAQDEGDIETEGDSTETEIVVGPITRARVTPNSDLIRHAARWRRTKSARTIVVPAIPENVCCVCNRRFRNLVRKEQHTCVARPDRKDIVSFAVFKTHELIKRGSLKYVQQKEAAMTKAGSSRYMEFPSGWAKRPKRGETLGRQYIDRYANDVKELFREGYFNKDKRMGPNRIRETLRSRYPNALDIPLEGEIRMAISKLMWKMKRGVDLSLGQCGAAGSSRGIKGSFPVILTVLINRIVMDRPDIRPKEAVALVLDKYDEQKNTYGVDEMPSEKKLRQKVSCQKQQLKKGVSLNTVLPPI